MLATVKLADPDASGTGFLLSRPSPDAAKPPQYFLITAEHCLARTRADEITVFFHKKNPDGSFEKAPLKLRIRQEGNPLWKKHPSLDVGIIPVTPPPHALPPAIPFGLLASDNDLEGFEIHPGDTVRCVGFPHPNQFDPSDAGFGVVRSGCIAGYPLVPTRTTKTFLIDMNTFEGDSGAPVYLAEDHRFLIGKTDPTPARLILGMMIGQHFLDEEFKAIYQTSKFRHRMGFGIVVHASAIKETLALFDPPAQPKAP
jgi:hypothetical protein